MELRKAILIFLGTVFVGLGVLGMFLPLLPTTIFLLGAAYCYSRSSDRFHNWLMTNRLCGTYIRNYRSRRGMTIKQKVSTLVSLWLSIMLSMWILGWRWWAVAILAVIAAGVSTHILRLRTRRPEDIHETADTAPPAAETS